METGPLNPYRPCRCNYIFVCKVAADGAFTIGPEGWTVERTAIGKVVVKHRLGHVNYIFLPVVSGTYRSVPTVSAFDEQTLTVELFDNGQPEDMPFQIMMMTSQQ